MVPFMRWRFVNRASFRQVAARHGGGRGYAPKPQQRRRDIAKLAALAQARRPLPGSVVARCGSFAHEEGDGVAGVGRLGAAVRVKHLFAVAVIGGENKTSARSQNSLLNAFHTGVHGFQRTDCGLNVAGMPDHVGIGEIAYDQIVGTPLRPVAPGRKQALRSFPA